MKENYVAQIVLYFGGRYAPMKASTYRIDFSIKSKDEMYNDMFIEISESKTMHDRILETGNNSKDAIKAILGR